MQAPVRNVSPSPVAVDHTTLYEMRTADHVLPGVTLFNWHNIISCSRDNDEGSGKSTKVLVENTTVKHKERKRYR